MTLTYKVTAWLSRRRDHRGGRWVTWANPAWETEALAQSYADTLNRGEGDAVGDYYSRAHVVVVDGAANTEVHRPVRVPAPWPRPTLRGRVLCALRGHPPFRVAPPLRETWGLIGHLLEGQIVDCWRCGARNVVEVRSPSVDDQGVRS